MLTRRTATRAGTLAAISFVVLLVTMLARPAATAGSSAWTPTDSQLSAALGGVQAEAWTTSPSGVDVSNVPKGVVSTLSGAPPKADADLSASESWPSTLRSVTYVATSRQTAMAWLDGSAAADDRQVIVARLVGDFSVQLAAPSEASPSDRAAVGDTETVVIDPDSGRVLDFAVGFAKTAVPLAGGTLLFNSSAKS